MSRKGRTTTSVSTLVNQINSLLVIAKVSGRKDLFKNFKTLKNRVDKLAEDYTLLRAEIDPFVKIMLTEVDISEDMEVEEVETPEA